MKKLFAACIVCIFSPFVSATPVTIGDLSYDGHVITNTTTGKTYLGWDKAAGLTYAQTLAATSAGGEYESYHIATQTEAYEFYHATGAFGPDHPFSDYHLYHHPLFSNGVFGDNYGGGIDWGSDYAWFLSDAGEDIGLLEISDWTISILDGYGSFSIADEYSAANPFTDRYASFLLVSDEIELSPVPVPAALPLFATALIALGFFRRRKQNKLT